MTRAPRFTPSSVSGSGRRTPRITSASASAARASGAMSAPAAAKSWSGRPEPTPAPVSTATSKPSVLKRLTVSGLAATRDSPGSRSRRTASFIGGSDQDEEGQEERDGEHDRGGLPAAGRQAERADDDPGKHDHGPRERRPVGAIGDEQQADQRGGRGENRHLRHLHEGAIGGGVLAEIGVGRRLGNRSGVH